MSAVDLRNGLGSAPSRRESAAAEPAEFAWRVLGLLNLFRLALGVVLLVAFALATAPHMLGAHDPGLAWRALLAMLFVGCVEMLLVYRRWPAVEIQTYLLFAADLAIVIALVHAGGGVSGGLGGLIVVSVGALALLSPTRRAFAFAAVAALALLFEQTVAQLSGHASVEQYLGTGVLGAVVFLIVSVAQLVRGRLVETEALAEQRGVDLRNLVELNEYIIQHLRESIAVVDGDDQVRLMNESAMKHFGAAARGRVRSLESLSPELAQRLGVWRQGAAGGAGQESGGAVATGTATSSAFAAADGSTLIEPHFAALGSDRSGGVVIFLEDTSLIAERVQQTKLAALGRLSASIAHEIRNPIGAMSHAGQLLAESANTSGEEKRLTDIIRVNANRVSKIVESVLALSRRDQTRPERLQLRPWMQDFVHEFVATLELYEGAVSVVGEESDLEAEMDPTHLHQIVWNLCDNAVKYASATAGAISVELGCGRLETSGRPYLEVADRGPGIEPDKVEQIFEPFYTGQPGGTGLGLYICRELCERNGATLRYLPRPGGGSQFRIVFADPSRWQPANEAEA
ncbi:MAG TPA: HAMP domain-containing sensor histidine kinase [Gammaproteobacteria bacterium]|nr:HAMP domain-containing sensor histidine kinase [Gammaproteobacteria bacterium]